MATRGKNLVKSPSPLFHFLAISPIPIPIIINSKFFNNSKPLQLRRRRRRNRHRKLCCAALLLAPPLFFFFFSFFLHSPSFLFLPCPSRSNSSYSSPSSPLLWASVQDSEPTFSATSIVPLPVHTINNNVSDEEREFWRQPEGEGHRPCLHFSFQYRRDSSKIVREKKRFLVVVVASGGLDQQRNQIIDAVVMARILRTALVVPLLQLNLVWQDQSEFEDIFDVEHFKRTLQADVRIVSSLPFTHLVSKHTVKNVHIPMGVSPLWLRSRLSKRLDEEGVLVLKGLDFKLSRNLPGDLQKLRCRVAFDALRFAAPLREVGERLTKRMWIEGPYMALHLPLEKDLWASPTGQGPRHNRAFADKRRSALNTNMTSDQRHLTGLCPSTALQVTRLLKGLGAPKSARIYVAGGKPFDGKLALQPLAAEFPNLVTKDMLALNGELQPYINSSSALAAIDYMVSLSSDVFVPSDGGNMDLAMQGHRAYVGRRKFIKPDKKGMAPSLEDDTNISKAVLWGFMRKLHWKSQEQPELRRPKERDRDVIAYPVPDCLCIKKHY